MRNQEKKSQVVVYGMAVIVLLALAGYTGFHEPHILLWYTLITALGWLAFPLAHLVFSSLPDRGYAFSRVFGLLVWGYLYWLLGVLGVLNNDYGGLLFCFSVLAAGSIWAFRKQGKSLLVTSLKNHQQAIIHVELLFALAFFAFALVRGFNPDITGTEKPMELAFINAVIRSPQFPPFDPWMSGHAISYYYFGYVLVGMIAKSTLTSGGVAFNLALSLVFALSAVGAYGLLYNLLSHYRTTKQNKAKLQTNAWWAWLSPFYVLIVSNLEGILHFLHNRGIFWHLDNAGNFVSAFWKWVDIRNLDKPPAQPFAPLASKFWWWWQASRIIRDYDLNHVDKGDVISEFPMFTYLLGDLHPHVLAMPFAFFAMALAMNLFFSRQDEHMRWLGMKFAIPGGFFYFSAVSIGALAFLNTWDVPFYVALFVGAYTFSRVTAGGFHWKRAAEEFIKLGIAFGVTSLIFYIPFFLGFSSQANAFLPNLIYITRGVHFWIIFAPFLVPMFAYLVYQWRRQRDSVILTDGMRSALWLILAAFAALLLLVGIVAIASGITKPQSSLNSAIQRYMSLMAATSWPSAILDGFKLRLKNPGMMITLFVFFSFVFALLVRKGKETMDDGNTGTMNSSQRFVLLMMLLGGILVFVPEFVFLGDFFGYRINTIFKFYYQAWLLWGVAAAYATVELVRQWKGVYSRLFQGGLVILLGLTMVYPYLGFISKTNAFNPQSGWTLDGTAFVTRTYSDESAAMNWLKRAPLGVVAEAIGGSYTGFARMATNSGQPAVLGWVFHEIQWRGVSNETGIRSKDIADLYCTKDWAEAKRVLRKYRIRYVVVGDLERQAYQPNTDACPLGLQTEKFDRHLQQAFKQNNVVIYLVTQ